MLQGLEGPGVIKVVQSGSTTSSSLSPMQSRCPADTSDVWMISYARASDISAPSSRRHKPPGPCFRHPIRRLQQRLGITNTPNIVASPMVSGALPDDARPTYRQGYFVTTVVNIQRQDWRTRWLTTRTQSVSGAVFTSSATPAEGTLSAKMTFCSAVRQRRLGPRSTFRPTMIDFTSR